MRERELEPMDIIVRIESTLKPGAGGDVEISTQAEKIGEIVRCEQCRHHAKSTSFPGDIPRVWCMVFYREMKYDGYCSIGQREKK